MKLCNFKHHLEVAKKLSNSELVKNLQSSGCISVTYRGYTTQLIERIANVQTNISTQR